MKTKLARSPEAPLTTAANASGWKWELLEAEPGFVDPGRLAPFSSEILNNLQLGLNFAPREGDLGARL